ncbi:MAG TPA: hypothetical protein ENK14_09280 [Caldithrix sp.]|nr:hypothetical protein [Caldithrix sp.]
MGHYVRSRWEANTCRLLKIFNIPYEYEAEQFKLNYNNATLIYIPDIKLLNDLFIEVKGWETEKARIKRKLMAEQYPEIKIIYQQDGAWLRRKGREIMENALQRFEKIDLVYGHNDPMAMGAYLAAKNAGRSQEMYFIGIDGLPGLEGGAQAVLNGELSATFLYPTGGAEAIQTALKILQGEKVPKNITLQTATIDSSNAKKYI